jgi:hypothetical protein
MGLDLWFREDVMRILASTHETMRASLRATSTGGESRDAYEQGFIDALRVVALAFGLTLQSGGASGKVPSCQPGDERLSGRGATRLDSPRNWR